MDIEILKISLNVQLVKTTVFKNTDLSWHY